MVFIFWFSIHHHHSSRNPNPISINYRYCYNERGRFKSSKNKAKMKRGSSSNSFRSNSIPGNNTQGSIDEDQNQLRVYDGGSGGKGLEFLTFDNLAKQQWEMFGRTVTLHSSSRLNYLQQEKRQTKLADEIRKIKVSICREDFPTMKAFIDIEFTPSAAQQAWEPFLSQICKKLGVEFIYSIIERGDKAPIFRILNLKDGGDYLVRQRESSAVLEVLNSSVPPVENSWESTKDIVEVKQDLAFSLKNIHRVNNRIVDLVSKPMTTLGEKEIGKQIQAILRPDGIVSLVNHLYLKDTANAYLLDMKMESLNLNYNQPALFERKRLDIISIHRQCIEKLNLMATQGMSEVIIKECLNYLLNVIFDLIYEVDVVITGLKLLSDLIPYLITHREKIFKTALSCIQYYAPNSPYHRPRKAPRVLEEQTEKAEKEAKLKEQQQQQQQLGTEQHTFNIGSATFTGLNSDQNTEFKMEQMRIQSNFLRLVNGIPEEQLTAVNKMSRYCSDMYVVEDEKSIYRKDTRSMAIFEHIKVIEIDENMQVVTPRTKFRRKQEKEKVLEEENRKKMARETERKGKEEKEKQDFLALQQKYHQKQQNIIASHINSGDGQSDNLAPALQPEKKITRIVLQDRSRKETKIVPKEEPMEEKKESKLSTLSMPKVHEDEDSCNNSLAEESSSAVGSLPQIITKPSELANEKKKPQKKEKKFRIIPKSFDDENEFDQEGTCSPLRWKGSVGEIGRKVAAAEAMDANRILSRGKSQKSLWSSEKSKTKSKLPIIPIEDPFDAKNLAAAEAEDEKSQNTATTVSTEVGGEQRTPNPRLLKMKSTRGKSTRFQPDSAVDSPKDDSTDKEAENKKPEDGKPVETAHAAVPSQEVANPSAENLPPTTDWLPNVTSTILRKQKPKFKLEPLPVVEYPKFRIFDYQMKANVVLTQGFATVLKLLLNNYGNRDYAFKTGLLMELAEIVLVSQAMPKILEYFIDCFHVLYAEGIGDPLDITWQEQEDPSMVLSAGNNGTTVAGDETTANGNEEQENQKKLDGNDGNASVEGDSSLQSKMFDIVSEMSLPSFDPDTQISVVSVSDHKYNQQNNKKNKKKKNGGKDESDTVQEEEAGDGPADIVIQQITTTASHRSVNAVAKPDNKKESTKSEEVYATSKEMATFSNRQRIRYNEAVLSRLGLSEYDYRYRKMPEDAVIIALALCAHHIEVRESLREEAGFWLEYFNDTSRDYFMLKRKGTNLANLS
jgi:hypothetical protein